MIKYVAGYRLRSPARSDCFGNYTLRLSKGQKLERRNFFFFIIFFLEKKNRQQSSIRVRLGVAEKGGGRLKFDFLFFFEV